MQTLVGILLCGGSARRFGGDKLLAGDPPVVARAARALRAAVDEVVAVAPPGRDALRRVLEAEGCTVLETGRTAEGMGASLAAGIAAAAGAAGWIVALGDMPSIAPPTIDAVRRALGEGAAIAAPFDPLGRRGHPVGFSHHLREALLGLRGDVGAREVLARHADQVTRIPSDDPGIFVDIDTPGDLARYLGTNLPVRGST